MGKLDSWNADGRDDMFKFAPEKLTLVTDKAHPLYDERVNFPVDESLVLNVLLNGVIEPVVIRQNGKHKDGTANVEVVDGRQRVKAAIEANKRLKASGKPTLLVATVRRRGEAADFAGVMISANEMRKGDSPLIKARKLQRFLAMGRQESEAAVQFGVTAQTIKNMLKILELHTDVQKAIEHGKIPATIAKDLSTLPQEEQPAALEKLIASGAVKGARGVEAVKKVRKGKDAAVAKVQKISRKELQAWAARLKAGEGKEVEIAYAVVSRILGAPRALSNFPRLKASLESEE